MNAAESPAAGSDGAAAPGSAAGCPRLTPRHTPGELLCPLPESGALDDFPTALDRLKSPPTSAGVVLRTMSPEISPHWCGEREAGRDGLTDDEGSGWDGRGPAPPSSTDSLVQGRGTEAELRGGLPEQPWLGPAGEPGSEVSPWPSASSLASSSGGGNSSSFGQRDGAWTMVHNLTVGT